MDHAAAMELTDALVGDGTLPSAVLGISDGHATRVIHAVPGATGHRVMPHSLFFLASVTKPIVATAVVQLVDEGRLDLHRPIGDLVRGYRGGRRDRVTAWHVLTHTSGIPDLDLDRMRRGRPSYRASLARVIASEPTFEPGTRFVYASDAFHLLAELVASLTGMGFQDALRARVLRPLGMVDTGFDVRRELRRVVDVQGFGRADPVTRRLMARFLAAASLPGGGLFGTAEDLLRFGRALLPRAAVPADAPRVVSDRAIGWMTREHTSGILETLDDGTTREPRYALGWHTPDRGPDGEVRLAGVDVPASRTAFTHGGVSGTRLWVDPERRLVVTVLSNRWGQDQAPIARIVAAAYGDRSAS